MPSFAELIIEMCKQHKEQMQNTIKSISPSHHAIYSSEMLPVCAICEDNNIGLIIESGRQFGYSTHILAEWFKSKDTTIVSIDLDPISPVAQQRLKPYGCNLELIQGDGKELIISFAELSETPCAVLMDGPKYDDALAIVSELHSIRETQKLVEWVFLHDMVDWEYEQWAEDEDSAEVFITREKEFKDNFSDLDHDFLIDLGFPPDSPGGGLAVIHLLEERYWK